MKVSELTGVALDWAVAKCENYVNNIRLDKFKQWQDLGRTQVKDDDYTYWHPSTDWGQAGPIIEREKIKVAPNLNGTWLGQIRHEKDHPRVAQKVLAGWTNQHGPTPLIAAMRCFVASKLGDDIEVPPELK